MRKLTSFLFMSLDGVVEAPHVFVGPEHYEEFPALIGETIAEQDAVLMGRTTYEEWAPLLARQRHSALCRLYQPRAEICRFAALLRRTGRVDGAARRGWRQRWAR